MNRDSAVQSGCCKPPVECGYEYVNPTVWINEARNWTDGDCGAWSSDQAELCYGCESCRAGLLGELREEWSKSSVVLVATTAALICIYAAAFSAFRHVQTEHLHCRYKQRLRVAAFLRRTPLELRPCQWQTERHRES